MKKELAILSLVVAAILAVNYSPSQQKPAASALISGMSLDWKAEGLATIPARRAEAKVGGDVAPDGAPVQVDLPQDLRMHNTGGRDGAGLCVFTSINHAAIWQDIEPLMDFQKWMKSKPGGGYPEKVAAMITRKCKELAVPEPKYVQVEGDDLEPTNLQRSRRGLDDYFPGSRSASAAAQQEMRFSGMRYALTILLVPFAALCNSKPTHGGWGPTGCGQVVSAGNSSVSFTGWKTVTPGVEQRYYRDGILVGCWLERERRWLCWREGRWVEEVPPWVEGCTCGCAACSAGCDCKEDHSCSDGACTCGVRNFGLDLAHMAGGKEPRYRVGGKPCDKRQLMAAMVEDDSAKPRLTIIGSRDERAKVLAALPAEASRYLVKAYDPGDWAVSRAGFKTDGQTYGHPTIYVQAPDGTVLHRQDTFSDAKQLAEALRKADPSYDQAKDPDVTKAFPFDSLKQLVAMVPPLGWIIGGILLLYFLKR